MPSYAQCLFFILNMTKLRRNFRHWYRITTRKMHALFYLRLTLVISDLIRVFVVHWERGLGKA